MALESNDLEMSLINIHPESVSYGLSWTALIFGLIVIGIVIFKIWLLIQNYIDKRRHAVELCKQRRKSLLNFAGNGIQIQRNPATRHVSLAQLSPDQTQMNDFKEQESTPSAPSPTNCKCCSSRNVRLYPGLGLTPNCTRK